MDKTSLATCLFLPLSSLEPLMIICITPTGSLSMVFLGVLTSGSGPLSSLSFLANFQSVLSLINLMFILRFVLSFRLCLNHFRLSLWSLEGSLLLILGAMIEAFSRVLYCSRVACNFLMYWIIYSVFRLLRSVSLTINRVFYPLPKVGEMMASLLATDLAAAHELSANWRIKGKENVFLRESE